MPADAVTVTAPTGDALTVIPTTETVQVTGADGKTYTEVAHFAIGTSGVFSVKVPSEGSLVAVAPAKSTAGKAVAWIVAIGVGAVLAIIGLILVVAARRRYSPR